MNLLSALPDLKRKIPYSKYQENKMMFTDGVIKTVKKNISYDKEAEGYNQVIDILDKYEICEEELAKVMWSKDNYCLGWDNWKAKNRPNSMEAEYLKSAKAIISSSHLWIKRKES